MIYKSQKTSKKGRRRRTPRRGNKTRKHAVCHGGGSKCANMREDTNYRLMGKLVCAWVNGEKDLYMNIVLRIIARDPSSFIRYVYENYTTFKPINRKALGQAFITFQEDAIKTYNLEHILHGTAGDEMLMPRDW